MCLFHFCSKGQTSHGSELCHPELVFLECEACDEPIKVIHGENSGQSREPIVRTWESSSQPQAHLRAHQQKNMDGSLLLWRLRTQACRVPRTGHCLVESKAKIRTLMGLHCWDWTKRRRWGRNLLASHQRCLVLRKGGGRGTRESVVVVVELLVWVVLLFWEPSSSEQCCWYFGEDCLHCLSAQIAYPAPFVPLLHVINVWRHALLCQTHNSSPSLMTPPPPPPFQMRRALTAGGDYGGFSIEH